MSTVGIIAEYNPFHKGHEYHISKAKEETGAEHAVVVMSGNFVQRGEPAIFNKYMRTQMALKGGADLVIELPVCFSTSSANFFAKGAVDLLDRLGVVDYISFGSESGSLEALSSLAKALVDESDEFQLYFKTELKQGKSIPTARQSAIDHIGLDGGLLSSPNNILAIEYLIALYEMGSNIKPHTLKRLGAGYNSKDIDKNEIGFASALSIRNALLDGIQVGDMLPAISSELIRDEKPIFYADIEKALFFKLFELLRLHDLNDFADVSHDFANKIINYFFQAGSLEQLIDRLASKDTTLAHTKRALIHILLNLKQVDFDNYIQNDYSYFARVLGFRCDSKELLNQISKADNLPIISNPKNGIDILNCFYEGNSQKLELATKQYKENCFADDVYRMLQTLKYRDVFRHDFAYKTVIV